MAEMDELFDLDSILVEEEPEEEISLATIASVGSNGVTLLLDGAEEAGEKEYKVNAGVWFAAGDRVKVFKTSGTYIVEYVVGKPMAEYPIPSGGSDGQYLAKNGSSGYGLKWVTPSTVHGIPAGGNTGQVLAKSSGTDYSVGWVNAAQGIPSGGTTGQVLQKRTNTNYDVEWVTPDTAHGIPTGGTANQVLTKNSATNYDVKWASAPSPSEISNGSYTVSLSSGGVLYPSRGNIALGASNGYWYGCYIKGSMRFGDSAYSPNAIGFFGHTPVSKQTLYSSSTLANVITLLQNYGLG